MKYNRNTWDTERVLEVKKPLLVKRSPVFFFSCFADIKVGIWPAITKWSTPRYFNKFYPAFNTHASQKPTVKLHYVNTEFHPFGHFKNVNYTRPWIVQNLYYDTN